MTKEKVTLEDLNAFVVGEEKIFTLPNWKVARSAQSFANQQKNYSGKSFSARIAPAIDGVEQRQVIIKRIS